MSKGDALMGKICLVATGLLFISASLVGAGNFEVLGESGMVRVPHPLHIKPGTLVKAEFKSTLKTTPDMELESDTILPEKVAARNETGQILKPALTYGERPPRGMAPPPAHQISESSALVAEAQDLNSDLEADLEKDLVLSPPPAKSDPGVESAPTTANKKASPDKGVIGLDKKLDGKKKAGATVKQTVPPIYDKLAGSTKPIRKVRPVTTTNSWFSVAGSHQKPSAIQPSSLNSDPRTLQPSEGIRNARGAYQYPMRELVPPSTASHNDRIVRDGVTIKLAPAAAGPSSPQPMGEEDGLGSDILSTAAEIIGLPFALISSFF
jgi:hypothetical protein